MKVVKLILAKRFRQFQFQNSNLLFVSGDPEGEHSGCETAVDPSDAAADPGKVLDPGKAIVKLIQVKLGSLVHLYHLK